MEEEKETEDAAFKESEEIKVTQNTEILEESKEEAVSTENEEPMVMSLRPLKEVNAYLVVDDLKEESYDITAVPLNVILENLMDKDGNPIQIDKNATVVWSYIKDEDGNIVQDNYHVIEKNENIDLSLAADSQSYVIELIVGTGKQLSSENVRYIVKVYFTSELSDLL